MTTLDFSEYIFKIRNLMDSLEHISGGVLCDMRDKNGRMLVQNHLQPLSSHLADGCKDLESLAIELFDFQRELDDLESW